MQLVKIWFLAVISAGLVGCTPDAQLPTPLRDSTADTTGDMVEEIVPDVAPSEQSQASSTTPEYDTICAIRGILGRFDNLWREPEPDRDQAIATLAQYGDDAVAEIELQIVDDEVNLDYGWGHNTVRVLEAINSEKSRTLLRRIALGELAKETTLPGQHEGCSPATRAKLSIYWLQRIGRCSKPLSMRWLVNPSITR